MQDRPQIVHIEIVPVTQGVSVRLVDRDEIRHLVPRGGIDPLTGRTCQELLAIGRGRHWLPVRS